MQGPHHSISRAKIAVFKIKTGIKISLKINAQLSSEGNVGIGYILFTNIFVIIVLFLYTVHVCTCPHHKFNNIQNDKKNVMSTNLVAFLSFPNQVTSVCMRSLSLPEGSLYFMYSPFDAYEFRRFFDKKAKHRSFTSITDIEK